MDCVSITFHEKFMIDKRPNFSFKKMTNELNASDFSESEIKIMQKSKNFCNVTLFLLLIHYNSEIYYH